MWVVRVALQRPCSFVVLALPIAIFGILAALNTPTENLPEPQHSGRQRALDRQRSREVFPCAVNQHASTGVTPAWR